MNCPNCHCPRSEPLTVATSSLVTRCQHAFHAVSPARPDDFATETAKDTTPPHPTHHGAAETVLGHPYTTPIPTAHDGSTGWVYCNTCESPQPVSGHECAPVVCMDGSRACAPGGACWFTGDLFNLSERALAAEGRAEFAEDLVNRLAFIHGGDHMEPGIYDDARAVAARQGNYGGWTWPLHAPGECVFCDAARGGGR